MKQHLYMKPRKPPKWWPRDPPLTGRHFAFVGVLKGGGWVTGEGSLMSPQQIKDAKEVMSLDWSKAIFEVR